MLTLGNPQWCNQLMGKTSCLGRTTVKTNVFNVQGQTTPLSQSLSISESASASECSADGKVPISFCLSSYIYLSMSILFADICPYPNIIKLYPFYIRIRSSRSSLNVDNFLIFDSIFALKASFFSALHTDENSTKIVVKYCLVWLNIISLNEGRRQSYWSGVTAKFGSGCGYGRWWEQKRMQNRRGVST